MHLTATAVRSGEVRPVDIEGEEYVLWRGMDGRLRSAPRRCPHLDHDLAEGHVARDELACPGHAWAFDGAWAARGGVTNIPAIAIPTTPTIEAERR